MDGREYDRIADLLMQIRGKIHNNLIVTHKKGAWTKEHYLIMVSRLLNATDQLADADQKGLI